MLQRQLLVVLDCDPTSQCQCCMLQRQLQRVVTDDLPIPAGVSGDIHGMTNGLPQLFVSP